MTNHSRIVIIFATFNGGDVLQRTLEGYVSQAAPKRPWRMIVADNNSTDDTSEILKRFSSQLPLETVFVAESGKNTALNQSLGLLREEDDFIVLTDDDAIPQPGFLCAWDLASEAFTDADLFAGRVVPYFLCDRPAWLNKFERNFDVLYAVNDRDDGPIEARNIFGPNMAVRRSVFAAGFRFDQNIGPNSRDRDYPMGSETEFCVRAEKSRKLKSRFVSASTVAHQIRARQTELGFIAGRAFRHGRGFAMQNADALGRFSKLKDSIKMCLLKLGMLVGSKHALWEYNWLRGFRSFQGDRAPRT